MALRKNLSVERGQKALFDDIRYFFYITNDYKSSPVEIVRSANGRCNQENLNEQLNKAMRMPVDNLVSNWAYMVMASLAWFALLLPQKGRWKEKHKRQKQAVLKMEFKKFRHALPDSKDGAKDSLSAALLAPLAESVFPWLLGFAIFVWLTKQPFEVAVRCRDNC